MIVANNDKETASHVNITNSYIYFWQGLFKVITILALPWNNSITQNLTLMLKTMKIILLRKPYSNASISYNLVHLIPIFPSLTDIKILLKKQKFFNLNN